MNQVRLRSNSYYLNTPPLPHEVQFKTTRFERSCSASYESELKVPFVRGSLQKITEEVSETSTKIKKSNTLWGVLRDTEFAIYNTREEQEATSPCLQSVSLYEVSTIRTSNLAEATFEIVLAGSDEFHPRQLKFKACTRDDMHLWLFGFQRAIAQIISSTIDGRSHSWKSRLISSSRSEQRGSLKNSLPKLEGLPLLVGYASNEGRRPRMEDVTIIIENLYEEKTKSPLGFFAIYDGHAGIEAAEYMSEKAHKYLLADPNLEEDPTKALTTSFLKIEQEFLEVANKNEILSGTTALVLLVTKNQLIVANAGDSRAVLSRGGKAVDLSKDHRPDREDERKRVEQAGGWVVSQEVLNVPRLYRLYSDVEDVEELENAEELVGWVTVYKVNGVLGMTRSIGDRLIKGKQKVEFFEKEFSEEVILAEPEVIYEKWSPEGEEEFVVLGCDGVWDVVSSQAAVDFVRQRLSEARNNKEVPDLSQIAEDLVEESIVMGSLDNISVIIVLFLKKDELRPAS
eukprot:TRINITY_DN1829_c0_g1_i1.p1 TRINITY_DN1829_c0_g1~~TRINITY_DN1829_c0_g1_i1.p1  ORF type:complete len:513 (-),score=93.01 TRINITY_DN1829_c0_g1_i1:4-1542(-)